MLENTNSILTKYLDLMAEAGNHDLQRPVSREHYLQRCWPIIDRIVNSKEKLTVVDAGSGHAHETILFAALGARVIGIDLREEGVKVALDNVQRFRAFFPSLDIELVNRDLFAAMEAVSPDLIYSKLAISHIHPAERFIDLAFQRLKKGGLLVINDENSVNPYVLVEGAFEHWKHKRLGWFVTDKYRDPVTKKIVPYAVERGMSSSELVRMFKRSGFYVEDEHISGYFPVLVAKRIPHATLHLESVLRRVPLVWRIGAQFTVCGRKTA